LVTGTASQKWTGSNVVFGSTNTNFQRAIDSHPAVVSANYDKLRLTFTGATYTSAVLTNLAIYIDNSICTILYRDTINKVITAQTPSKSAGTLTAKIQTIDIPYQDKASFEAETIKYDIFKNNEHVYAKVIVNPTLT
jgi:hypothetical protein